MREMVLNMRFYYYYYSERITEFKQMILGCERKSLTKNKEIRHHIKYVLFDWIKTNCSLIQDLSPRDEFGKEQRPIKEKKNHGFKKRIKQSWVMNIKWGPRSNVLQAWGRAQTETNSLPARQHESS